MLQLQLQKSLYLLKVHFSIKTCMWYLIGYSYRVGVATHPTIIENLATVCNHLWMQTFSGASWTRFACACVCVCGGGGGGGAIETYLVVWHPIICTSLEVNNNIISSVLHANVQPATILKFSKAKSRPLQQVVAKTMPNLNHEERISWRYLSSWKSDGVPNLIIS
jgi:hypothetical protein